MEPNRQCSQRSDRTISLCRILLSVHLRPRHVFIQPFELTSLCRANRAQGIVHETVTLVVHHGKPVNSWSPRTVSICDVNATLVRNWWQRIPCNYAAPMICKMSLSDSFNVALISGFPAEQRGKVLVQGAVFLRADTLARSLDKSITPSRDVHTAASNAQTASSHAKTVAAMALHVA